ncbi:MAG TPA: DUF3108 domain-containing protein [Bryobacteraceae bacterium]|jgi:hypothetical protein
MTSSVILRLAGVLFLTGAPLTNAAPAEAPHEDPVFPCPEKLTYSVEWRLVTAGIAVIEQKRGAGQGWDLNLNLQSAGLVSRLYKVLDTYKVTTGERFCGSSAVLDAQEGKKHTLTQLNFNNSRKKIEYNERNLLKNTTVTNELDKPACTYEVLGALAALRLAPPEPGRPVSLPVTNGKKLAFARLEAQGKESLNVGGKSYSTVRYEAFLFDNVLYRRKGRLFIWLADGAGHLPVQLQVHLGFPVGNITIQLEKEEKL